MFATTFETVNGLPVRPCEMRAQVRNCAEADAVARLKAGDQTVFRELVDRYQSKIRNVTFGILGSREDADEIAQRSSPRFILPSRASMLAAPYTPGFIALLSTSVTDSCVKGGSDRSTKVTRATVR
jgi:hypothetical protein